MIIQSLQNIFYPLISSYFLHFFDFFYRFLRNSMFSYHLILKFIFHFQFVHIEHELLLDPHLGARGFVKMNVQRDLLILKWMVSCQYLIIKFISIIFPFCHEICYHYQQKDYFHLSDQLFFLIILRLWWRLHPMYHNQAIIIIMESIIYMFHSKYK